MRCETFWLRVRPKEIRRRKAVKKESRVLRQPLQRTIVYATFLSYDPASFFVDPLSVKKENSNENCQQKENDSENCQKKENSSVNCQEKRLNQPSTKDLSMRPWASPRWETTGRGRWKAF